MNNDYKIIFNESEHFYELIKGDEVIQSGTWDQCVRYLAEVLITCEPDFRGETMQDAMEAAKEIIENQIDDEDLNGYMLQDLSDDLREQERLNMLVLDFACDVLEVMRTAKREIFGASPEVRQLIRTQAYQSVQDLIDQYADRVTDMEG